MRKHILPFILLASALFFLPPCARADKPLIIVSILPQKYVVSEIAGDDVDTLVLVKAGSDPHTYEPSPSQLKSCSTGAAYLTIGVPFELTWLPRLKAVAPKLPIHSVLGGIALLPLAGGCEHNHEHGDEHGHEHDHHHAAAHFTDPHVWTTPKNLTILAQETYKQLVLLLPDRKEIMAANLAKLEEKLTKLDEYIQKTLDPLPAKNRIFMTFHPSWQYFAKMYGLQEIAIETDEKEPSARAMKTLIDIAKNHRLKIIFVAPQFPKTTAKTIASSTGAQIITIDPLAENCIQMLTDLANALATQVAQKK